MSVPEDPAPPRKRREPARGNPLVRSLGWALGTLVILGTVLLVLVSVMQPLPEEQPAAALKPVRKCPPDVSVPARALGFPVDDVMGVRPGMSARDLTEIVKCMSEDFEIETREGARPLMVAKLGPQTFTAALYGAKDREQVASIWREVYFDAGQGPPLATVEASLMTQYGAPHDSRTTPEGARILTWTYAPDGRAIRVRPRDGDIGGMVSHMALGLKVSDCLKHVRPDPAAPATFDVDCGLTLRAEIDPSLSNRTQTARWRIVMLDQPTLARKTARPATP
jgi:hypothetical protein